MAVAINQRYRVQHQMDGYYPAEFTIVVLDIYASQGQQVAQVKIVEIHSNDAPADPRLRKQKAFYETQGFGILVSDLAVLTPLP